MLIASEKKNSVTFDGRTTEEREREREREREAVAQVHWGRLNLKAAAVVVVEAVCGKLTRIGR